jgi:hypothetical protein
MKKFTVLLTVALSASTAFAARNTPLHNWTVNANRVTVANAITPTNAVFVAMDPCRLIDTRNANGPYGGPKMTANTLRTVDVVNGPCTGIPSNATAYSMNFTATQEEGDGHLTAGPTGTPITASSTSTMNYRPGVNIANATIVPAGTSGQIDVYSFAATHFIIDINGYFIELPASGTGDITSVVAGTGLTGGATSGDATVGIADGGVDTLQLADTAVTTAKIDTGAVTSNEIFDGTVASVDIADGTVDTADLKNLSVTAAKMSSEANPTGMFLSSDGAGNVVWTLGGTSLKNSNSVVITTDLTNICSVNGIGNLNAVSINTGALNGGNAGGAFVIATPNGLSGTAGVYGTNFPPVAAGFIPNGQLLTDCPNNKWVLYTTNGTAMPVGISWSVFGQK